MLRHSVYIETSIISHLTSQRSRDVVNLARQVITQDWWETQKSSFDVYISALAAQGLQIATGDFQILSDSVDAQTLAKQLIVSNAMPHHRVDDAVTSPWPHAAVWTIC